MLRQPVQLMYMQRDGLDTGGAASVLTVKAIAYQVGIMVIALVAIISSYGLFRDRVPAFGWLALLGFSTNLLVAAGMLLLALSPRTTAKIYGAIVRALHRVRLLRDVEAANDKARAQFDIYHESTRRYDQKRGQVVWVLVLTCLQLILMYLVPYMIYRAFGYSQAGVLPILSAVAFVSMVSAFVPLPGGSGGAEGSFVLFFGHDDLLAALLLWRIITYYAGMIIGALVMMISRKRQRACIRLPL